MEKQKQFIINIAINHFFKCGFKAVAMDFWNTLIRLSLNIHSKLIANFQKQLNLDALIGSDIFYSLRSIVISKGLVILEKARIDTKVPLFPLIFGVVEYRKLSGNL